METWICSSRGSIYCRYFNLDSSLDPGVGFNSLWSWRKFCAEVCFAISQIFSFPGNEISVFISTSQHYWEFLSIFFWCCFELFFMVQGRRGYVTSGVFLFSITTISIFLRPPHLPFWSMGFHSPKVQQRPCRRWNSGGWPLIWKAYRSKSAGLCSLSVIMF